MSPLDLLHATPLARLLAHAGLMIAACVGALSAPADPVVRVSGGRVRGRVLGGSGAVFLGVPFAAPPVGALRWREPMPVVPWEGVRDVWVPGPPAAQRSYGYNASIAAASREDCLYLNVWTPGLGPGARAPVMVWIHGGANLALAGGSEPLYDGSRLAARGVVLVVLEYRLGVFGFLAHPELSRESPHGCSGNYGIMDQVAALAWVRDNIAAFGGDPGNVTVFGQSAGSWNTTALLSSPLARGLFHRAIAMSGAPTRDLCRTLGEAEAAGARLAASLGAPASGSLAWLRAMPARELAERGEDTNLFCSDGWVLPRVPADAFAAGSESRVPVIMGGNAVEITTLTSPGQVRDAIAATFGAGSGPVLAAYGFHAGAQGLPADPVYGDVMDQWCSDLFRCPCTVFGEWHRAAGNPVWMYEFDRAIAPHPRVQHSAELPFVFGNFRDKDGMVTGTFRPGDRELSDVVQAYWTNFAKNGDPNGPGLPPWPGFGAGRAFMVFGADGKARVGNDLRGVQTALFRSRMIAQEAGVR